MPSTVAVDTAVTSAEVWFPGDGRIETACVEREGLAIGERVEGPAIIKEWDATTVVPPRSTATVEKTGDLLIALS